MASSQRLRSPSNPRVREHVAGAGSRRPAASPILQLQRTAGNRAVSGLVRAGAIQTLTIGRRGDVYEQQADRVAARVVRHLHEAESVDHPAGTDALTVAPGALASAPTALVQRQEMPEEEEMLMMRGDATTPAIQRQEIPEEEEMLMMRRDATTPVIQRQEALEEEEFVAARGDAPVPAVQRQIEEEEEEELLQPSPSSAAGPVNAAPSGGPDSLQARLGLARGGGQSLDATVRRPLEGAFGYDFSRVRLHTNTESDTLARRLQAEAFTTGEDIFFRAGRYHPGTDTGRFLLAHELTHVVQQGTSADDRISESANQRESEKANER